MHDKQVADKLLEEVPETLRLQYSSYLTLHIKELMTQLRKNKIEDCTDSKVTWNVILEEK